MRRDGLWHAELVRVILSARHHDTIVIADAGLPVPAHVPTIDLGWRRGEPRVLPVLGAVLDEMVVEAATIAEEANDPELLAALEGELGTIPVSRTTHEELKDSCARARAVVRTGDDTPFANVVLHAGVPFGTESLDLVVAAASPNGRKAHGEKGPPR